MRGRSERIEHQRRLTPIQFPKDSHDHHRRHSPAGALTLTQGTATGSIAALESEADAALKTDAPTFDQRAALVDRIDRARGTSSGETAAAPGAALAPRRQVDVLEHSTGAARRRAAQPLDPRASGSRRLERAGRGVDPRRRRHLEACTPNTATRRSRSRSPGSPSRMDCRGSARATSRATRSA